MTQKFGARFRAARSNVLPFRHTSERFRLPKSAQSVTQITYDAALSSYIRDHEMHPPAKESVMTWTSDRTGVLLYAVLATLFVMAWIYVPA
jgi:hypothetical protein